MTKVILKWSLVLLMISIIFTGCDKGDNNPIIPPDNSGITYEDLLAELNFARTNPKDYAKLIEAILPYYNGKYLQYPGETRIYTWEGKAAAEEAIQALKSQQSLNPLQLNIGLNKASQYHCDKQGIIGVTGHDSPDGKTMKDRILMYGTLGGSYMIGENIAYGSPTARRIIIELIIDDGVANRGHRDNIYEPSWTDVGFGWGYHKEYKIMCVMDFAKGYIAIIKE